MIQVAVKTPSGKGVSSNRDGDVRADNLTYAFTSVKMPTGGAKLQIDHIKDITNKRCIITIRNKDNLCMARAIVVAKANIEKPQNLKVINMQRPIVGKMAEKLHDDCFIVHDVCGIDESIHLHSI